MSSPLKVLIGILLLGVSAFAGVTVSSPTAGSTVSSPVHFVASATMSGTVTAMAIYVDNTLQYKVSGAKIDTTLSLASGSRYVVVQSWNSAGDVSKATPMTITVSSSSTTVPSGTKTYANIDQMTGWQDCGSCAGIGGNGPTVPYSLSQNQSTPSMDGKSALFWIGGTTPYSDALWWKQLGANANVKHFIYDLYFYYTDSAAPQSLEFDANQSVGGYKYIFGTQCAIRGSGTWEVWDGANGKWRSTGIACPAPPTYKWNHLVWEFERVGSQVHFISVTLNGTKSYVNRYYYEKASGASELNVAFQMDGNYQQADFKVWLDKVNFYAW